MLHGLLPGAPIWLDKQVFGFMTADRFSDGDDLWMLSTGTGVGPFVAILRDTAVWRQFRRIVIAHGVKRAPDLRLWQRLACNAGKAAGCREAPRCTLSKR